MSFFPFKALQIALERLLWLKADKKEVCLKAKQPTRLSARLAATSSPLAYALKSEGASEGKGTF